MRLNKNIKLIINYILGPLVFLFLSYSIYHQVIRQPNWRGSLDQIRQVVMGPQQWKLWLVVALMPLNWGIEARKWQLTLRPVARISYRDAFRAVFTGTTMASFTPNRMGEYLGRMLYVTEGKRLQSISLTIIGSMAQLLITLGMGIAGILYLNGHIHGQDIPGRHALPLFLDGLLGLVIVLLVSLTIIYFRLSSLVGILGRISFLKKYLIYAEGLKEFKTTFLIRILYLSFCRYLVFLVQYCLVFPVFGVLLTPWQVGGGISVVFLIMAVVPTFTFLTELGLRWEVSIQIIEFFSANTVGIFAASFTIWLINLIVPALIGSLLILSIKLFKNK